MLTALNAKKTTEESIEKMGKERRAKAIDFCEELSKGITINAQNGKYEMQFTYDDIEIKKEINCILKENGYTITELNNRTSVLHW